MAKNFKIGTKSRCRHCDTPVIWADPPEAKDSWRPRTAWFHADPFERVCPNQDQGDKDGYYHKTYADPVDFCTSSTYDGTFYNICNRKPVWKFWCGIHAKAEKAKEEQKERLSQDRAINNYIEAELRKLCDQIGEETGLSCRMSYSSIKSGEVSVDPVRLLEVLRQHDRNKS